MGVQNPPDLMSGSHSYPGETGGLALADVSRVNPKCGEVTPGAPAPNCGCRAPGLGLKGSECRPGGLPGTITIV